MATTQEILVKEPSQTLLEAVEDCVNSFDKTAIAVTKCLEIGKREGFTPRAIGDMIRQRLLRAGFHRSTVSRVLPPEAKHMERAGTDQQGEGPRRILQRQPISPGDYQSEDLLKYNKQFLIEVIRYLEEKYVIRQQKQTIKHVVEQAKASTESKPKPKLNSISPYSRDPVNKTPDAKQQQVLQLHNEGK